MPDWNTRLAVSYEANGQVTTISPIDSFNPSFSLNAEPIHSIEATHLGVVYQPSQLTFSLTVKTIGSVAARLTKLAIEGTLFDISLLEEDGEDWAFSTIVLRDCVLTSAQPANTSASGGAPSATFSGFSLTAETNGKTPEGVATTDTRRTG
ncbi:MAG: hypothetical protein KG028_01810 [Actinobacteria bacterium]|jgi:hypothetical protein|nr:hypothetical protein [Actinomycetota bacterium]